MVVRGGLWPIFEGRGQLVLSTEYGDSFGVVVDSNKVAGQTTVVSGGTCGFDGYCGGSRLNPDSGSGNMIDGSREGGWK